MDSKIKTYDPTQKSMNLNRSDLIWPKNTKYSTLIVYIDLDQSRFMNNLYPWTPTAC